VKKKAQHLPRVSQARAHVWLMSFVVLVALCGADQAWAIKLELQPQGQIGADLRRGGEVSQIRIAQQYGLAYLPLMIMRQLALIEKHASAAGLGNLRVHWMLYPSGEAMNQAIQLGFLDIASGGVVPLIRLWDQTRGGAGVKGMAALASMPLYLNTRRLKVRTVADFTDTDRIAVPAVKTSIQAVILQMAAAQTFGAQNYKRLDPLTVSMPHPQARDALIAGSDGITAHFGSPPYQNEELADRKIHRVLNSYDVLGGTATFTVMWARSDFHELNPRTYQAIYGALKEAIDILNKDKTHAAEIFVQQASSPYTVDFISKIIGDSYVEYTNAPKNVLKYARFLHQTGAIQVAPAKWTEVFFPEVYGEEGS
jgi:NitT/TauT family transport system substrate-binding protein